ncbi:MATE family efflux transporter [Parahalioglobus pacificus]|uniref:MATE family efflux transporter n=1 Tax=Parahalioglobus pacificus TaxID=930806 RepID=A0A919CKY9_9GAMM|nr:MATE family efflux transporter [Halioglobus pacificus]GHD34592.1 MATE family efflux transporter [Halioglobus pacificus]
MAQLRPIDRKIWGIAWPAILSNLSIPLLGLVDGAILGNLGDARYLGAVALGAALLSFLYWGFSFLRMGTTGLVARAVGAEDQEEAFLVLARSMALALGLALLVALAHPLWLGAGFALMQPSQELLPLANSYASLRIISAPAVLLTYAIVGWFIGHQNTRWPMAIMITTNLINIGLDFLFIIGLGWGSDGAAIATVVAEYMGLALALTLVARDVAPDKWRAALPQLMNISGYGRLLQSNRDLFLRTVCLLASFAFFTSMGEKLGPEVLAANALLLQLLMLAAYGLDGFAFAAEGLCGTALGARQLDGFYAAVRRCAFWTYLTAIGLSISFALLHPVLFPWLTNLPEISTQLYRHVPWLIALPILAAPSYLLDGVFIGSAQTRPMMWTMLASAALVYLPLWYFTQALGNHGLWLSFSLFNAARGVSLWAYYRHYNATGRWLQTR